MKKRTLGIILIVFPWLLFPLTVVAFTLLASIAIMVGMSGVKITNESLGPLSYVVMNMSMPTVDQVLVATKLGIIVGNPVGLYLVLKKEKPAESKA